MVQLAIEHPDGRAWNVTDAAFKDLYEPFGFKAVGVIYGGSRHAYTKENVKAAEEYEAAGLSPNETALTVEADARVAIVEGQEERASDLIKRSATLRKAEADSRVPLQTNPPDNADAGGDPNATVKESGEVAANAVPVSETPAGKKK